MYDPNICIIKNSFVTSTVLYFMKKPGGSNHLSMIVLENLHGDVEITLSSVKIISNLLSSKSFVLQLLTLTLK